jgi:hypothetical protein
LLSHGVRAVPPNALAHRSRASDAWLGTETQSRDSVHPVR